LIAARCGPEVAEALIPVSPLRRMVEIVDATLVRVEALEAALGGARESRDGQDGSAGQPSRLNGGL
jgi:hypothetical protein